MLTSTEKVAPSQTDTLRRRIVPGIVKGLLAMTGLLSVTALLWNNTELFLLNEAGYGDSYILYDVLQFQKTGIIYRDLSRPPYLPAQYSPLVYMLFSVPGQLSDMANPFVGPRLIVISAFLGCIAVVVSIIRSLIPIRFVWVWGILLVASISAMWNWTLQIRADFPGICFSLLTIRFLLSRHRWAVPLAGLCAGLALQFKITFVAAGATGALWLLAGRQWKDLWRFSVVAAIVSAGLYVFFWVREPQMIAQMLALSPGVSHVEGALMLLRATAGEPVLFLALLGVPTAVVQARPHWWLMLAFAAISFVVAGLTSIQAGASVNYYFEALLALTPTAVLGVQRLMALSRRHLLPGLLIALFVGGYFLAPRARYLYSRIQAPAPSVALRNESFRKVERVLQKYRTFSTVPRVALIDSAPTLMEPYLLSYLHRLGKADLGPILRSIRGSSFDGVITSRKAGGWRDIPHIDPDLHAAIAGAYKPHCVVAGVLVHLPESRPAGSSRLAGDLEGIGCQPMSQAAMMEW